MQELYLCMPVSGSINLCREYVVTHAHMLRYRPRPPFSACENSAAKTADKKIWTIALPTLKETGISLGSGNKVSQCSSSMGVESGATASRKKEQGLHGFHSRTKSCHSENGNTATVKKYKADSEGGLGESTIQLFKKQYTDELKKATERTAPGIVLEVKSITSKKRRHLLTSGDIDSKVQAYVRPLERLALQHLMKLKQLTEVYLGHPARMGTPVPTQHAEGHNAHALTIQCASKQPSRDPTD